MNPSFLKDCSAGNMCQNDADDLGHTYLTCLYAGNNHGVDLDEGAFEGSIGTRRQAATDHIMGDEPTCVYKCVYEIV